VTVRLAEVALSHWGDLDGYAVAHGMPDLRTLPAERFANYVWWFLTRNADENSREKFRLRLWQPPAGEVPPPGSPWSAEAETSAFESMKRTLGVSGRPN